MWSQNSGLYWGRPNTPNRDGEIHSYSTQKLSCPPVQPNSGLIPPPFTCVGPQRRLPLPPIGLGARPQFPVRSGLPSARRGVAAAAVFVAAAASADSVQFGG